TTSNGWDGTFNGKRLSSDDYWFKVILQDGRTFMGHFSLKR
ncbi:T9SS type B sorting domain-containing protein, partial [Snuella sedimenti]